jgi:predicted nucleic acid-binding Zn ribbon protein
MSGIVLKTVKAKLYCVECGTELTGKQEKFCSPYCSMRFHTNLARERGTGGYLNSPTSRKYERCVECGKPLSGNQKKFCSPTCRDKSPKKRERVRASRGTKTQKAKVYYVLLRGGCCQECGYHKNIASLCFHHLDPSKKTLSLNCGVLSSTEESVVVAELKNCVLLCHNCHSELHNPELEGLLDPPVTRPVLPTPDPRSDTSHENVVSLPVKRTKGETSPVVAHTT